MNIVGLPHFEHGALKLTSWHRTCSIPSVNAASLIDVLDVLSCFRNCDWPSSCAAFRTASWNSSPLGCIRVAALLAASLKSSPPFT